MTTSLDQQLEQLETEKSLDEQLAQAEGQKDPIKSMLERAADSFSRPFNKGLMSIPGMLPGGDSLRADLTKFGILSPEGQESTGVVPRTMELLGASALPGGALQMGGRQVIKQGIPLAQQTVRQALASQTAVNPAATAGLDIAGSLSAALSGEGAEQFSDDPNVKSTAEIVGGIGIPAATIAAPKIAGLVAEKLPVSGGLIRAGKAIKESFNTTDRQINRLQSLSADPNKAAARIETKSPVSPARQTEEPRLVALEEQILKEAPAKIAQTHRQAASKAEAQAVQNAKYFSGDKEVPRDVLKQKSKDQVARVVKRADKALEEADAAIAKLDSGADPRDVSRAERTRLETALKTARKEEKAIWGELDQQAPAATKNTKSALDKLKVDESDLTLGDNVPGKVNLLLAKQQKYDKVQAQLAKEKDPVKLAELEIKAESLQVTMKDLQSVRSELGDQMFKLQVEGKWNQHRIVKKFYNSLMDDMGEVDSVGIDKARAFSRELNAKFTKGEVGQILKIAKTGVKEVDNPETLHKLFQGDSVTRGIRQMLDASPDSRQGIEDFAKSRFILQVVKPDGTVNQNTANRVLKRYRQQGIFEEFPELEGQIVNAMKTSGKAVNYQKRVDIVKQRGGARLEQDSNDSLASIYLKQPVGKETELLLKAKHPVQLAARLRRAMSGNEEAEKGLRRSFAEVLLRSAETSKVNVDTGENVINGAKYAKAIRDNIGTLRSLGFTKPQIQRMRRSATVLRQLQIPPESGAVKGVMEDNPAWMLSIPARVFGARVGGKIGHGSSGASIQTANIFANRSEQLLRFMTTDRARKAMIDMIDDKALWKAFLTGQKAPKVDQERAVKALETWLYGMGVDIASKKTEDESES